jgi:hypothetical protein
MRRWMGIAGSVLAAALSVLILVNQAQAATITEQTPVKVKLLQKLKSGHDRKGDKIRFAIVADVKGSDQSILIPKGTPVVGTIIRSTSRRMFGQPGRLEFTIDYIKIGDQIRVPLRTTSTSASGQNHTAATTAAAVLVAPIAVFVKGENASVKEGTQYTVYVDQTSQVPGVQTAKALDAAKNGIERPCVFRLKDGRTVTGFLESFQGGVYFVGTDLGRLQISQEKVESISAGQ